MELRTEQDWVQFTSVQRHGFQDSLFWNQEFLVHDNKPAEQDYTLTICCYPPSNEILTSFTEFLTTDVKMQTLHIDISSFDPTSGSQWHTRFLNTIMKALADRSAKIELNLETRYFRDVVLESPIRCVEKLLINCVNFSRDDITAMMNGVKQMLSSMKEWEIDLSPVRSQVYSNTEWAEVIAESNLERLRMSVFILDETTMSSLTAAFKNHPTLTTLEYFECSMGDAGVALLAKALPPLLTRLEVMACEVGPEGAKALSRALVQENCRVRELDVSCNNIGSNGAVALSDVLKSDRCLLKKLDLAVNNIGPVGATALADGLKTDGCPVEELNVSYNDIRDEGALALAGVLKKSFTLTSISLEENHYNDLGAMAFNDAMKVNPTVIEFEDYDNTYNKKYELAIEKAVRRNRELVAVKKLTVRLGEEENAKTKSARLMLALSRCAKSDFAELPFLLLKSQSSDLAQEVSKKRGSVSSNLEPEGPQLKKVRISSHLQVALDKLEAVGLSLENLPNVRETPDWETFAEALSLSPLQLMVLKNHKLQ